VISSVPNSQERKVKGVAKAIEIEEGKEEAI